MTAAHRVTWFAPDRPVDGGTIFVRPDTPESPMTDTDRVARRVANTLAHRPALTAELRALLDGTR